MDADRHGIFRQAAGWLILLREDPGAPAARERFEAWLDEDPAHVRAWASVSDMFDTIGETGPEFQREWQPAVAAGTPQQHRRGTRVWPRLHPARPRRAAWGGAVAAALALAWIAPSAMLHLRSDYMTGSGETDTVALADGSAVQLGPESAIAVDYRKGARTVRLLAGQAWFDVKRDPDAPFHVVAGEVRTTVLGTSFDVRRSGNSTAVSVGHGHVRVVDQGANTRSARDLSAGDWVSVDAGHHMTSGSGNPAILGAWRGGTLVVRNRPIAEVIDELRPWYGGRIISLNSVLGRKHVDGVFDASDPAGVLAAIARQQGGTVRRVTPWLLIIS